VIDGGKTEALMERSAGASTPTYRNTAFPEPRPRFPTFQREAAQYPHL